MRKPEALNLRLLSVAAYAGMFVFGIVMALLGAILPSIAGRLQFEVADIGALFLVMNAAMLACFTGTLAVGSNLVGLCLVVSGLLPVTAEKFLAQVAGGTPPPVA